MDSQTSRTYEQTTAGGTGPLQALVLSLKPARHKPYLTNGEDKPIEYNKHCATFINTLYDSLEIQADRRFYIGFFVLLNNLAIFLTYRRGRILTKKTRR